MTGFVPPPYPYDRLDEITAIAARHEGGAVDLSIGTPCDPPPPAVLAALSAGDTARGYPPSIGTPAFRAAAARWIERRLGASVDPATEVAACVGTKEFVASLPQYLRLRDPSRDTVLYPAISYPTYEMGATLAGLRAVPYLSLSDVSDEDALARALRVGELAGQPHRRAGRPRRPRRRGGAIAAFSWSRTSATRSSPGPTGPTTILREGHGRRDRAALAVQAGQLRRRPDRSLRRRRGARPLPARGAQARRADAARPGTGRGRHRAGRRRARRSPAHPLPRATAAAGDDPGRRRLSGRAAGRCFLPVVRGAGGDAWAAARDLAERAGIVVSPGEFYGPHSTGYVRIAAVQPDDRIELAAARVGA